MSDAREQYPTRVVALGGGTGLPAVLRGLRRLIHSGDVSALTAVVAMTDDGGSSGRLRRSMGMLPPGDVRNCLVALADEEEMLAELFQHRYGGCEELGGHTVGNLILAGLAEQTGSFLKAVELSSHVLRTVGRILPATLDDVRLRAELADGSSIEGETAIAEVEQPIARVSVSPSEVEPTPGVIESIREADLVVLGPGSLYTSLLPNLIIPGIGRALRETDASVVMLANLVSERGEASGLGLPDHVRVIEKHVGGACIDAVLVNDGPIDEAMLGRYREEGAFPLTWPEEESPRIRVVRRNLLAEGPKLRHDSLATVSGVVAAWAELKKSQEHTV